MESLLSHDHMATIIVDDKLRPSKTDAPAPDPRTALIRALGKRRVWSLIVAGFLIVVGIWAHGRIEATMLGIRARELESVLRSDVAALELWIAEQQVQLRLLAQDPRVVPPALELLALDVEGAFAARYVAAVARLRRAR